MRLRNELLIPLFAIGLFGQKVELVPAVPVFLPGVADSNSPIHWDNGKRYAFNSDGWPVRSEGVELAGMRYARSTSVDANIGPWWLEATYRADDGTIYGWYHHEQNANCDLPDGRTMSAPVIGAVVSTDNGRTFRDLGIVLASGYEPNCDARNGYFAGGNGDFSVISDREKQYLYFFFSTYGGPASEQGVAVARMALADRDQPVGNVWKFLDDGWESEGLWGRVTPVFQVRTPWESEYTDAFWGPGLHYNRELGEFVMLLNHSCCTPGWPAEGIFVSFNADLANPKGWMEPERIVEGGGWYPMAVGLEPGDTDKEAGSRARFFMGSDSHWELIFRKGQQGVLSTPMQRAGKEFGVETRRHMPRTFKSERQTGAAPSASQQNTPRAQE